MSKFKSGSKLRFPRSATSSAAGRVILRQDELNGESTGADVMRFLGMPEELIEVNDKEDYERIEAEVSMLGRAARAVFQVSHGERLKAITCKYAEECSEPATIVACIQETVALFGAAFGTPSNLGTKGFPYKSRWDAHGVAVKFECRERANSPRLRLNVRFQRKYQTTQAAQLSEPVNLH